MFRKGEDHENPAWPGLVDLFSFTAMLLMLLWVTSEAKTETQRQSCEHLKGELDSCTGRLARCEEDMRILKGGMDRHLIEIATALHEAIMRVGDPLIDSEFLGDRPSFRIRILDESESRRPLTFDTGSFSLKEHERASVHTVAAEIGPLMRPYPEAILAIEGTADPRPIRGDGGGPPRDNIELSALRSAEVARCLMDGSSELAKRIHVVGLGEQGDLLPGATDEHYRQYRKVELEIRVIQGDPLKTRTP